MSKSSMKRAMAAQKPAATGGFRDFIPHGGRTPSAIAREWADKTRAKLIESGGQEEWEKWRVALRRKILSISLADGISGLEAGLVYLSRVEKRTDISEGERKALGALILCVSILEFGS